MPIFTMRSARSEDEERLLELAEAFHAEDGHALDGEGRRALAGILAGEPAARAFLFELDGTPVGYGVLTLGYSIEHGGRDGFLDDFYLAFRRQAQDRKMFAHDVVPLRHNGLIRGVKLSADRLSSRGAPAASRQAGRQASVTAQSP